MKFHVEGKLLCDVFDDVKACEMKVTIGQTENILQNYFEIFHITAWLADAEE